MGEKKDNIYIYLWEEFNTIYVGRTINPKSRHYQHRHIPTEKTYKFSSEHGVEHPKMVIIENDLTIDEGVEREKYWIEYYRNNASYNVLNKTSGGQIGSRKAKKTLTEEEKVEHRKQYYQNNKEKILSYNKQYIKTHKEKILSQKSKYREKHREELREKAKKYSKNYPKEKKRLNDIKYRNEHKEEIKKYYENNKDKILLRQAKYREKHREELREKRRNYMREYMKNKRKMLKTL